MSHSKRAYAKLLLGISDLDSPRNGMLWSIPVENAWEDSRICLTYLPQKETFRVHVLDCRMLEPGVLLIDPLPGKPSK